MTKGKFVDYIESGCVEDEEAMSQLLSLAVQFPFSAAVQKVVLKSLSVDGDVRYDERLPLVATVVRDRKKLHDFIHAYDVEKKDLHVVSKYHEDEVHPISEEVKVAECDETDVLAKEYFEDISYTTHIYSLTDIPIEKDDEIKGARNARTFSDWLRHMEDRKNVRQKYEIENESINQTNDKWSLIENFIKEQPEIKPSNIKEQPKSTRQDIEKSNKESEEFMTETLAQIYIKQKHYEKAIKIFEKLSLKYPEKNTYFAGQIKLIGKLKNNEKE